MQDKIQFIPEEDLKVVSVPFAALSQTQNWGMSIANIQDVWEISKQGEGIKVAILDTGFQNILIQLKHGKLKKLSTAPEKLVLTMQEVDMEFTLLELLLALIMILVQLVLRQKLSVMLLEFQTIVVVEVMTQLLQV